MRMKHWVAALLSTLILSSCAVGQLPDTTETQTGTAECTSATTTPPPATTTTTSTSATTTASSEGSLRQIPLETPVFSEPNYDGFSTGIVGEDGVYTITETVADGEDNLWGWLKSGIGWVDLTALDAQAAADVPVAVFYAEDSLWSRAQHVYQDEPSEYAVRIMFRAREDLSGLVFSLLEQTEAGYATGQILYTAERIAEGEFLAAEIVFFGDMTAYGFSLTDKEGRERTFAVTVSGRNGMLLLSEY